MIKKKYIESTNFYVERKISFIGTYKGEDILPKHLLSGNGTHFVNKNVQIVLDDCGSII